MQFIHVVAANRGFRDQSSNPDRWALLDKLLNLPARQEVRLLVLPGGYFTAPDFEAMLGFIEEIGQRADRTGVAVIGGIDLESLPTKWTRSEETVIRDGLLPYFAIAVGPLTIRPPLHSSSTAGKASKTVEVGVVFEKASSSTRRSGKGQAWRPR